jgi:UDP-glucose 4-epimerase
LPDKLKILVTGGAGYIGSHCVKELCDAGHHITILDNFSLGLRENIDPRVQKVVEGDVRNSTDLEHALRGAQAVFHFAAWKAAGESMDDPAKYAENNICGTLNLLQAMLRLDVKYIVFSSSAAVYGNPQYQPIDEKHPTIPENYYGYTKLAIEQNLKWYSQLKGIKYAALRYFNATGYDIQGQIKGKEKNPANLSPVVMETAIGVRQKMLVFGNDYNTKDGTCFRDYIHVNDLASAHLLAMNYIFEKNEDLLVNLGTGSGYTVLEVIEAVQRVTGKNVSYEFVGRRAGDPEGLVASCKQAYDMLGWKAKYSDLDTIFKTMHQVYK